MPDSNLQHFFNKARADNFFDGTGLQVVAGCHGARHVSGSCGQQHRLARARTGSDSDWDPRCVVSDEVRSGATGAPPGEWWSEWLVVGGEWLVVEWLSW